MRDRPPIRSAGWRNAEANHVAVADEPTTVALAELARIIPQLDRTAPALMAAMRDHHTGQPQAAHYGTDGDEDDAGRRRASEWCTIHEQFADLCDEAALAVVEARGWSKASFLNDLIYELPRCVGETHTGPSDPVGNAAMVRDVAAQDLAAFRRHVERALNEMRGAMAIRSGYPSVATPPPDDDGSPGADLCRSCFRCNGYPKLIELKPGTTTPYYRGLCRWCGVTRKALVGNYAQDDPAFDPPKWLVEWHIDNGRIPQGKADEAQAEMDRKVEQHRAAKASQAAKSGRKRK